MFESELIKKSIENIIENITIRLEDNIQDMVKDTKQLKTFVYPLKPLPQSGSIRLKIHYKISYIMYNAH